MEKQTLADTLIGKVSVLQSVQILREKQQLQGDEQTITERLLLHTSQLAKLHRPLSDAIKNIRLIQTSVSILDMSSPEIKEEKLKKAIANLNHPFSKTMYSVIGCANALSLNLSNYLKDGEGTPLDELSPDVIPDFVLIHIGHLSLTLDRITRLEGNNYREILESSVTIIFDFMIHLSKICKFDFYEFASTYWFVPEIPY